jgi:hypothetical protein
MTEFHAQGWFTIFGNRPVASIAGIKDFNPRSLTGKDVTIDGEQYHVKGVETFAAPDSVVTGKSFGLLVDDT